MDTGTVRSKSLWENQIAKGTEVDTCQNDYTVFQRIWELQEWKKKAEDRTEWSIILKKALIMPKNKHV